MADEATTRYAPRTELEAWAAIEHYDLTLPKAFAYTARTALAAMDDAIRMAHVQFEECGCVSSRPSGDYCQWCHDAQAVIDRWSP